MNSRWFAPLIFASAILGWLTAMALPDVLWLDQLTQLLRTACLLYTSPSPRD